MTASDTDIFIDTIPTPSEGVLVVDWDVAASREVIFYNSKTASKVVCPSAANGRGFDGSTATTHASGANVIMAPVADYFRYIQYIATTSTAAWKPLGYTPDTITDNGNGSYTFVFNSVDLTTFISNGMRLKGTPATAKPTQCTSLNGTTQYFSKAAPAATTFTDDFVTGAWIKLSSNPASDVGIISRSDGSNGWWMGVQANNVITLSGSNAAAGNYSRVISNTGITVSRWYHVAALLDMSAFTAAAATAETAKSWIMINGVEQAAGVLRAGTNPTSLVNSGTINVGAINGANFFPGKIAQAFYSNTRITQANVRLLKNQGITAALCTTHNIVSAYSFNNSIADINTGNANDLTANGSATATNADSPFGQNDAGVPGTTEWGIVTGRTFSTNTTLTVQAPEGSTWPTSPSSGAISSMSYSTEKLPFGFPAQKEKWTLQLICKQDLIQSAPGSGTWYNPSAVSGTSFGQFLTVPIGDWNIGIEAGSGQDFAATGACRSQVTLATTAAAETDIELTGGAGGQTIQFAGGWVARQKYVSLSAATPYYVNSRTIAGGASIVYVLGSLFGATRVYAECAYL